MVEKQNSNSPKILKLGTGGKHHSTLLHQLLEKRGTMHRPTSPEKLFQNVGAERMKRTLAELVRATLWYRSISKPFRADAPTVAAYIQNRVTTGGLPATTASF